MTDETFANISLRDAGLFSALAYAAPGQDAFAWGSAQGGGSALAAVDLQAGGWVDITNTLSIFAHVSYATQSNEFRVFLNNVSNQIVFAFKGTSNPENLLSDFNLADQGASAYEDIEPAAQAVLSYIKNNPSLYGSYKIVVDGHSLGGGMAQSFALYNNLSGFGQNALPIAVNTIQTYFPEGIATAKANYSASGATFQELNAEGDPATALYAGGTYLGMPSTSPRGSRRRTRPSSSQEVTPLRVAAP